MKPTGPVFDLEWRTATTIERVSIVAVDHFVKAHYLHKRPAIVVLCLAAIRDLKPIGMVVYAMPPREADKRYGGKTWELARLYLLDGIPANAETWLIGKSVRYIKANHPDVKVLLSYADPSAGHAGTIYKAANWTPDGMTDGDRKTPRFDYIDTRTGKKYGRRGNVPADATIGRVARVSKHRFFYRLTAKPAHTCKPAKEAKP